MRSRSSRLLIISGVILCFVIPVGAANNQGFEWNYEYNTSMAFSIGYHIDDEDISGRLLVVPRYYPELPDDISSWDDIPAPSVRGGFDDVDANRDLNLYEHTIFTYLHRTGGRFAVPIGNFDSLTEIANTSIDDVSIIDDSDFWGIEAFISSDGDSLRVVTRFAKSDGFLAQHFVYLVNDLEEEEEVGIYRTGFATNQLTLDIGYFGVAAILIVAILFMKVKKWSS